MSKKNSFKMCPHVSMSILLMVAYLSIFSQGSYQDNNLNTNPTLEQKIIKASTIVEGKVIATKGFRGDHGIYTSATVQISKIFKGQMYDSTFELIFIGGRIDSIFTYVPDAFSISKEHDGIFLLKENTTGNSDNPNLKSFIPSDGPYGLIEYHHDVVNHKATSPGAYYDDLERELYQGIESITHQSRKVIGLNSFEMEAMKNQKK